MKDHSRQMQRLVQNRMVRAMGGRIDIPTRKAFARRLKLMRERAGIKMAKDLAAQIGEEINTYTRWERAETEPSISQILRICRVLNCTPNDLLLRDAADHDGAAD